MVLSGSAAPQPAIRTRGVGGRRPPSSARHGLARGDPLALDGEEAGEAAPESGADRFAADGADLVAWGDAGRPGRRGRRAGGTPPLAGVTDEALADGEVLAEAALVGAGPGQGLEEPVEVLRGGDGARSRAVGAGLGRRPVSTVPGPSSTKSWSPALVLQGGDRLAPAHRAAQLGAQEVPPNLPRRRGPVASTFVTTGVSVARQATSSRALLEAFACRRHERGVEGAPDLAGAGPSWRRAPGRSRHRRRVRGACRRGPCGRGR